MSYPVRFEMDYIEKRSRLTTFFRYLLAIPHLVVIALYGLAAYVVYVIAWFALLFTGRWPEGLYGFMGGYLRYHARFMAYYYLGVDQYPPFGGGDDPAYPVRVTIDPPLASYSRLKVFFRPLYAIVAMIIAYGLLIVTGIAGMVGWFVIVITGKQPKGIQDAIQLGVSYSVRSTALIMLVTETYPAVSEQGEHGGPAPAAPATTG